MVSLDSADYFHGNYFTDRLEEGIKRVFGLVVNTARDFVSIALNSRVGKYLLTKAKVKIARKLLYVLQVRFGVVFCGS
jgi:hypothetical protein